MTSLKPPRLRKGDLIGIISPASPPSSKEKIDKGVQYLERLGYHVKVGRYVLSQHGYLAGPDEERARDLNEMLADRKVKAIFAIRGGYGTPRLLHLVNYGAIRSNPKIIVGYSDLTALQLAVYRKTGLVTFSGPMVGVEMWNSMDPFTEEHFWRIITSSSRIGLLPNPPDEQTTVLNKGSATGRLLGGNLSLLVSVFGTPYVPDLRKSLLILEDVDEAPHRIDRMFTQLSHSGTLKHISGMILGKFTDCVPSDPSKPHLTVEQVLDGVLKTVSCPTITNFPYGHIPRKLTIPFGVRARLSVRTGSVEVLEGAVRENA